MSDVLGVHLTSDEVEELYVLLLMTRNPQFMRDEVINDPSVRRAREFLVEKLIGAGYAAERLAPMVSPAGDPTTGQKLPRGWHEVTVPDGFELMVRYNKPGYQTYSPTTASDPRDAIVQLIEHAPGKRQGYIYVTHELLSTAAVPPYQHLMDMLARGVLALPQDGA